MNRDGYQIMTYKNRLESLRRLYSNTDVCSSTLISDYTCAIFAGSPKILQQGRMYITVDYVCFYCRILRHEQKILININDIVSLTKEKTAMIFPNAIQILTKKEERHFFTSFNTRDRTFHIISKLWSEHKSGIELSTAVIWDRIRENYGNELGFCQDDPEYEESRATQLIARYKIIRRPSEILDNSSQDDSIYESLDDSLSNDSRDDLSSSFGSNNIKNDVCKRNSNHLKLIDEDEIKFDLHSLSKQSAESMIKTSLPVNDILPQIEVSLPPAQCKGHDHHATVTLDEEFNINVTTLWTYLFTDNAFFRALSAMRMIVNITQSSWPEETDGSSAICRTIYYTVNLKNRIGPKQSPTVEKQVRLPGSQDNYIYLVESTVRTVGIPLSDSFHVVIQYCLLYVSPTRSRLKMSMKVVYDKSVFFATKSIIESTVKSSCLDYNKDLKSSLVNESKKINLNSAEEKVHQCQTSIEDSYNDPVIDDCMDNSTIGDTTKVSDDSRISWMAMVLVCCSALLVLYLIKELFSDQKIGPLLSTPNHNQPIYESSSLNEIMELIHEMKNAIEVLKKNIEILNKVNPCVIQSTSVTGD